MSPRLHDQIDHADWRGAAICSNVRGLRLSNWRAAAELDPARARVIEGDLLLCEAVTVGGYDFVEDLRGDEIPLRPGSRFVAVAGFRESGRSLCGAPPAYSDDAAHLLNNGGLVGTAHAPPLHLFPLTEVRCLGRLSIGGQPLSVLPPESPRPPAPDWLRGRPHVVVLGTSAEVGKTTFMGKVIAQAVAASLDPLCLKIAGSGRLRDKLSFLAAGANDAIDFADFGLASTYTAPEIYRRGLNDMLAYCRQSACDMVITEVGGDALSGNVDTFLAAIGPEAWTTTTAVVVAADVNSLIGLEKVLSPLVPAPLSYHPHYASNMAAFHRRRAAFLGDILEETDPDKLVRWALDVRSHA